MEGETRKKMGGDDECCLMGERVDGGRVRSCQSVICEKEMSSWRRVSAWSICLVWSCGRVVGESQEKKNDWRRGRWS